MQPKQDHRLKQKVPSRANPVLDRVVFGEHWQVTFEDIQFDLHLAHFSVQSLISRIGL